MPKPLKLIAAAAIVAASPWAGAASAWGSARTGAQYQPGPIPTSEVPTSEVPNVAGGDVGRGVSAPAGRLAKTGGNTAELAAKGGALVMAGGGMVVLSRRRRRSY